LTDGCYKLPPHGLPPCHSFSSFTGPGLGLLN
jgi:hypothetical protein